MRVVIVIQARLNSSRLPRKMLLPLGGHPIVSQVINRCLLSQKADDVVLTVPAWDKEILNLIPNSSPLLISPCWYEEWNLIDRFARVVTDFHADVVCRVPADNPCVDPLVIDQHITHFLDHPQLWTSSQFLATEYGIVNGLGTEICLGAWYQYLDETLSNDLQKVWREHPHLYWMENGLGVFPFSINNQSQGDVITLDINTRADYDRMKPVYDAVFAEDPLFRGVKVAQRLRL